MESFERKDIITNGISKMKEKKYPKMIKKIKTRKNNSH